MDNSRYKVILHWHHNLEDEEFLFDNRSELNNFLENIRNKGKRYNCSYDIYRIQEELYSVIYQEDLLNHNFDIEELIDGKFQNE